MLFKKMLRILKIATILMSVTANTNLNKPRSVSLKDSIPKLTNTHAALKLVKHMQKHPHLSKHIKTHADFLKYTQTHPEFWKDTQTHPRQTHRRVLKHTRKAPLKHTPLKHTPLKHTPLKHTPKVPLKHTPLKHTPKAPLKHTPKAPLKHTPKAPLKHTPKAPLKHTPKQSLKSSGGASAEEDGDNTTTIVVAISCFLVLGILVFIVYPRKCKKKENKKLASKPLTKEMLNFDFYKD